MKNKNKINNRKLKKTKKYFLIVLYFFIMLYYKCIQIKLKKNLSEENYRVIIGINYPIKGSLKEQIRK